jgi:outer membrane lipopolysaccharide assembly protein LptE/RlpB
MTRWRPAAGLALCLLVLLAGGCGYSLRGTLPAHIQTIAVPVFQNKTVEPGIETIVTRAVVEAFSTSGRLRVVRPEQADAILEGEVIDYDVQSIAFDPREQVRFYRLIVTMNLRLRDLRQNRLVFDQRAFRERADFRASEAVTETIAREDLGVRKAARDIARSVVSLTVDGI